MMKSKPSLKNLARCGLLFNLCLILSCSSSTTPTYLKENIIGAIQNICNKEYNIAVNARLVGETLWIYIPVEDIFERSDKPEKYLERFEVEENKVHLKNGLLKLEYTIKPMPEQEKFQEYKYSKAVLEKNSSVWKVLRRVLFSMERKNKAEPKFFCIITTDIKNGVELKEMFYYLDLKKVSYGFISWTEYQHRDIQDIDLVPKAIGDSEGSHLDYRNVTPEEFIANQIRYRIKLKFQKPEVEKTVDIDKEIIKIVVNTVKIYDFKDFSEAELNNLFTKNKITLRQAALPERPID